MARNTPATIDPDTYLSSHEVGAMLQCNPSSINKWVKEGKLHAHRTPGGHRRMRAGDVVAFLVKFHMPVPPQLKSAQDKHPERPSSSAKEYGLDPLEVALKSKPRPKPAAPPSLFVFPVKAQQLKKRARR